MQADYLIIGQGLAGTLLSWFFYREGKSFVVMDEGQKDTASKIAAGIINPVTGRRYVTTWMIEEVMPFAIQTYRELEKELDIKLVYEKSIIDFFPSAQMRNAFVDRVSEDDTYLHAYPDQNHFNQFFQYDFGCGEVKPAYLIDVQLLLTRWRDFLIAKNRFIDQRFAQEELKIQKDCIQYDDLMAQKILFCDGIESFRNPWFQLLPFAPNKGEALLIRCEGLDNQHIFKKGMILAPMAEAHTFWVGSTYQWEFSDPHPTESFLQQTRSLLDRWLKRPFEIISHKASVRPATIERRPFVGLHPHQDQLGILNGLGTKGTSLAPFFAHQLSQHLVHGFPVSPEADIRRFSRILSK
ncbi:MAG TPA: FAD-dependent oxidoreductase [Flavisolibacter sp.]|jgi:glycine/D-amino acid oxidase-like deaminating enzyme|nr:FAD-dependent oxidoreductase [Flavisolibacter sp.]